MADELESGAYVTPSVRLLHLLAEGGMGKVWVAEHLVLDTKVVVKLMAKEIEGVVDAAGRFAREAAIAAAVKSPHVVQVFDSGVTEGGVAYIVMELLEGHDLGAHLATRGRMKPAELEVVISQLGKALAKAHRVGVVHRDIKPDNIFLCEVEGGEPFVKLLDFGTAKDELRAPTKTGAGQLLGTPYYMSPEQILGEAIDARSDVWSLGVVAFEALTGVRPFEGFTVGAITLAIHTTKPRLTEVAPELPAALDAWFARACARSPDERFPSAREAVEAFTAAIASGGEAKVLELAPTSDEDLSSAARARERERIVVPSVATSLSSTLASPRGERRTMTWLAAGVGVVALIVMVVLLTNDGERRTAPAVAPSGSFTATSQPPLPPPASSMVTSMPVTAASASASVAAPSASAPTPRRPPNELPVNPALPALVAPPLPTTPVPATSALPPAAAAATTAPSGAPTLDATAPVAPTEPRDVPPPATTPAPLPRELEIPIPVPAPDPASTP